MKPISIIFKPIKKAFWKKFNKFQLIKKLTNKTT